MNLDKPTSVGVCSGDLEPKDLILWLPNGVVSALSSAWSDGFEMIPMVDVAVSVGGETVRFVVNDSACEELSELFARMAKEAREQSEEANETIYGAD